MKGTAAVQASGPGWSSLKPRAQAESGGARHHCAVSREEEAAACLRPSDAHLRAQGLRREGRFAEVAKAGAGGETLLPLRFDTGGKPNSPSLPFMSIGKVMAAERHGKT